MPKNHITDATAKYVLRKMYETDREPEDIINEENLWAFSDEENAWLANVAARAIKKLMKELDER